MCGRSAALNRQVTQFVHGHEARTDRFTSQPRCGDDTDNRGMRSRPDAPDVQIRDCGVAPCLDKLDDLRRNMIIGRIKQNRAGVAHQRL